MVIDERSEPHTRKKIQHQIESSEHSRDEYRMRLEVYPESDSEPQEHVRKSSDRGVDEDVGEEDRGFHYKFQFFMDNARSYHVCASIYCVVLLI